MANTVMSMYTIYQNPSDYPPGYVIRRWEINGPVPIPTTQAAWSQSLENVRSLVPPGLVRMERSPGDDPTILETWI